MLVYRIEHKNVYCGPYSYNGLSSDCRTLGVSLSYNHSGCNKHKVFKGDKGYVSGMLSLQELKHWFSGFLKKLHRNNYVVRVFEASKYQIATPDYQSQVVFLREESKLLREFGILQRKVEK